MGASIRFKVDIYKTKNGLSANATKALAQDTNNILWIGLDEGLSRFDGSRFRNFRNDLPSRYIKYLYRTRSNRLLVGHDLGIAEIHETPDTIRFQEILHGERTETDSTINYPKQIFEEQDGSLWIAESKSVVRLHNGTMRRYAFPVRCQTNSFVRSFSFAEDGFGGVIACSQTGYCYYFNRSTNSFQEIILPSTDAPLEAASDMLCIGKGRLWIAYSGGIYELHTNEKGTLQAAFKRVSLDGASTLHRTKEGAILVGTWLSGLFLINKREAPPLEIVENTSQTPDKNSSSRASLTVHPCPLPFSTVNMILSGKHGEIWISSDEGLALLKPSAIVPVELASTSRGYIQAITQDSGGNIYTSDGMAAYRLRATMTTQANGIRTIRAGNSVNTGLGGNILSGGFMENTAEAKSVSAEQLLRTRGTDFLCLAHTRTALWCGTTDGKLFRLPAQNLALVRLPSKGIAFDSIFTLSKTERNPTLFYLFADSRQNLWATGELDAGALRISESATTSLPKVEVYNASRGLPSVIRAFRESPEGVVFAAGRSRQRMQYLFRYDAANDRFHDISKPFPKEVQDECEINDIAVRNADDIWLCTGLGLFHYTASGVVKVPLYYAPTGEEIINMKAIAVDENGTLWIGTSQGVVVYRGKGDYFFLNENGGLPANEIAFRAILWGGKESGMWIGTAKGLVNVPNAGTTPPVTPPPMPIFLKINGKKEPLTEIYRQNNGAGSLTNTGIQANKNEIVFPYGSDIQLGFLSVVFGEDIVSYQYRLLDEREADSMRPAEDDHADSTWSEPQQEAVATFLTLPTGRYRLEVRAIEPGAYRWSEPMILRFRIDAAWHERWWTRVFMLLLALSVIALAVKIYVRRLEKQKRALQELVQERTREIEEKNIEITQSSERLAEQNEQLRSLDAEKNEFLGIVAHDIRSPLSGVQGIAEILLSDGENIAPEMREKLLEQVIASTNRILHLASNLLKINAFERGANTYHFCDFDILSIMHTAVATYRERAETKNILLHVEHPTEARVYADEALVMQVLDNLLSNAVKYSPHGKNIFVRLNSSNDAVRIEVQDEGQGISPEDMQKLFGKFARLSAQPTGGEDSTGLGLSIVKKMVEAMNGKVWCESELGKGATFIVELPAAF
ncbi:MAG: hypothetical protein EAZ92_01215 [Candidatus Kapaibacterium sp.]|nr:MAG: hypothetical protein EAZ92_01215 [Candidatus Kapabacteria bacterium]